MGLGTHRKRSTEDWERVKPMICELCPRKAIIAEQRGFAIRYMCGECYALTDDEFYEKEARMKERQTKHTELEGKPEIIKAIPKSQLTLF